MHRCLQIPEILGHIVDHVKPKGAFQLALTSKRFLEPCLDRVWEAIDSFAPLIACLPLDLWRNETFPSPEGHDHEYTLLHLERALTAEDMHRYQTYYATRIREFSLDLPNGIELPSLEFLQALNILADSRPGFLSPRLKKFVWYGYNDAAGLLGDGILEHLAPYMFLFLGETVDSLEVDFELEEPILHTASLKLSMRQLGASLRHLSFCGEARINECLKDYKFPNLTRIDVYRMLPTTIPLLATLPQLHTLHIHSIYGGQVPPPLQRATIGFASLRRAFGAGRISDCKRILPQLPPCNALQELEWELDVGSLRVDLQDALEAAEVNCNPLTLTRVAMWRTPLFWTTKDESVEIEDPDQVNLSPLYPFKQLEHLEFQVVHSVYITPAVIEEIAISWSRLHCLILCPKNSTSHIPLINHHDVLRLVRDLPHLRELGIQFDATRISMPEQSVGHISTFGLRTFRVGASPICSPSRMVVFLNLNFPFLEELDIGYYRRPNESGLFVQRWVAVKNHWEASRNDQ